MANLTGARIRTNNVFGTLTDNPLLIGALTMNSAGLANLDAVSSAHAIIVLDPLRVAGAPEIVVVTAHTGSATSATISRASAGTVARQHLLGTLWVHAPTIWDAIAVVTSSTRPSDTYEGQMIYETDTDSYKGWNGSAWEHGLTLGAWTAYTPTLTQSATVTKTVNWAHYVKIGRLTVAQFKLTVTGSGTAANAVLVGLPVTAAALPAGTTIGTGSIFDASATDIFTGAANVASSTTMQYYPAAGDTTGNPLGVSVFTAGLASGDEVAGMIMLEAAA